MRTTRRALLAVGAVIAVLLLLGVWLQNRAVETEKPSVWALAVCGDVPKEVDAAVAAVRSGGPYLRPRDDGGTFGNREALLPPMPDGYYREYTVRAPREKFPGPRRLVTGGQQWQGGEPEVWYYTADHYQSYCQLYPTGGRAR